EDEGRALYAHGGNISNQALTVLLTHQWPGNIRQLKNTLRAALALSGGATIGLEHLPEEFQGIRRSGFPPNRMSSIDIRIPRIEAAVHSDRDALIQVLKESQWNITDAARKLGTCRATVYRRMQK